MKKNWALDDADDLATEHLQRKMTFRTYVRQQMEKRVPKTKKGGTQKDEDELEETAFRCAPDFIQLLKLRVGPLLSKPGCCFKISSITHDSKPFFEILYEGRKVVRRSFESVLKKEKRKETPALRGPFLEEFSEVRREDGGLEDFFLARVIDSYDATFLKLFGRTLQSILDLEPFYTLQFEESAPFNFTVFNGPRDVALYIQFHPEVWIRPPLKAYVNSLFRKTPFNFRIPDVCDSSLNNLDIFYVPSSSPFLEEMILRISLQEGLEPDLFLKRGLLVKPTELASLFLTKEIEDGDRAFLEGLARVIEGLVDFQRKYLKGPTVDGWHQLSVFIGEGGMRALFIQFNPGPFESSSKISRPFLREGPSSESVHKGKFLLNLNGKYAKYGQKSI